MPVHCTCLSPLPGQHSALHWLSHPPMSTGTPGWWLRVLSACAPSSQSPEGPGRYTVRHVSVCALLTACFEEQQACGDDPTSACHAGMLSQGQAGICSSLS